MADEEIAPELRVCTLCKTKKPETLEHFPPHKEGRKGISPNCRACKRADEARRRSLPGYQDRHKAWKAANPEKVAASRQRSVESGARAAQDKAYRLANADALREKDRLKMARRRKESPQFVLAGRMSGRMRQALIARCFGSKAGRSWKALVGYTTVDLALHLERQFKRGMNWKNMHRWHIDHIRPVAEFSYTSTDDLEFRECWALTNLRPMWAKENLAKSDKRLFLL